MPARKIAQAEWERHRTVLENLYLHKNMKLAEIKDHMDKKHGFNASDNQYRLAFEKLGFRKKLSDNDWKYVDHRIKKRKADDKDNAVYLNGNRVPAPKVHKELSRRFPPTFLTYMQAPSPDTPPGIQVRTPGTPMTLVRTPGHSGTPEERRYRELRLPWFQLQSLLQSEVNEYRAWAISIFDRGHISPSPTLSIAPLNPHVPTAPFSPHSHHERRVQNAVQNARPLITGIFAGLLPSGTELNSEESTLAIYSRLQHFMLEQSHGELLSSIKAVLGPSNRDTMLDFLKFSAYLASNNMLPQEQSDKFLDWVTTTRSQAALRSLFATKVPTIAAFARNLFVSALQTENTAVVRILLDAGVKPNGPTTVDGLTPLQLVAQSKNMELFNLLLRAGADVNAVSAKGSRTALHIAVERYNVDLVTTLLERNAKVNLGPSFKGRTVLAEALLAFHPRLVGDMLSTWREIFNMLLDHGASCSDRTYINSSRTALQYAVELEFLEAYDFLLSKGADVNAPAAQKDADKRSSGGTALQLLMGRLNGVYFDSVEVMELIETLVGRGVDVNAAGVWDRALPHPREKELGETNESAGVTAIQAAAKSGTMELVSLVLESGADVNVSPCPGGKTTLAFALAQYNFDLELINFLLSAGAEVNPPPMKMCQTPLQAAIGNYKAPLIIIEHLLHLGADINTTSCGMCPLSMAIEGKRTDCAMMLLEWGANVNPSVGEPPLVEAIEIGDLGLIDTLLERGAEVAGNRYQITPLEIALSLNNIDIIERLKRAGAEASIIDSSDFVVDTAILRACTAYEEPEKCTTLEVLNKLLRSGVRIDQTYPMDGDTFWVSNVLPYIIRIHGNYEISRVHDEDKKKDRILGIIHLLLEYGADVNASWLLDYEGRGEEGEDKVIDSLCTTAVLEATRYLQLDLLKLFVQHGADVNARPQPFGGWAPIQVTALRGGSDCMQFLIAEGADVNAAAYPEGGRTALQAAISEDHLEISQLLLDNGADINALPAETNGITALQGCAIRGQLGFACMLIEKGADVNAPRAKDGGRTALEGAAEHGRLDMVQLLLDAKADIGGDYAKRAKELAEVNGHTVVADILSQF